MVVLRAAVDQPACCHNEAGFEACKQAGLLAASRFTKPLVLLFLLLVVVFVCHSSIVAHCQRLSRALTGPARVDNQPVVVPNQAFTCTCPVGQCCKVQMVWHCSVFDMVVCCGSTDL